VAPGPGPVLAGPAFVGPPRGIAWWGRPVGLCWRARPLGPVLAGPAFGARSDGLGLLGTVTVLFETSPYQLRVYGHCATRGNVLRIGA